MVPATAPQANPARTGQNQEMPPPAGGAGCSAAVFFFALAPSRKFPPKGNYPANRWLRSGIEAIDRP